MKGLKHGNVRKQLGIQTEKEEFINKIKKLSKDEIIEIIKASDSYTGN
jgi:hypothetical protein